MQAGLILVVGAIGVARELEQARRQPVGCCTRAPDEIDLRRHQARHQAAKFRFIEAVRVAPGRVGGAAVAARRARHPQILPVRHADDHAVRGNTNEFATDLGQLLRRDVLKHFGAHDGVEGVVGERQRDCIALHTLDARVLDRRRGKIECDDALETLGQHQ